MWPQGKQWLNLGLSQLSARAADANPRHCLAPLPGRLHPRPRAPQECGMAGRGDPCSRGGRGGTASQGAASKPGSTAAGHWGWVRAQLGSAMSGGLCCAWARPRFVYSFSLLFCLTIYSWLPFSHGGCIYLARRAWSLPGSRAAAEQSCNPA